MNPFLLYMVKAALTLAALYTVYLSFLGRDTMYERNRYYILFSVLASLIFPLIVIETRQPIDIQFFGKDLTDAVVNNNPDSLINPAAVSYPYRISTIILNVYFAGLVIFGIRTIAELLSLLYLIIRHKNSEDNIIWLKNNRTAGFSAFGYIFIDARLNNDVAADIIRHEQKHLDNLHFLDILLIEVLKAVQWFNPFIYMVDRALREVHEFQADEECLNSGIAVKRYQGLLLNQVFRTNVFNATDDFSNPTIIKKRIVMMTRRRSKTLTNLKMLMTLPVVTFLLISFSTYYAEENAMTTAAGPSVFTELYPALPPPPDKEMVQPYQTDAIKKSQTSDRADDVRLSRAESSLPASEPGKEKGVTVPVGHMAAINLSPGTGEYSSLPAPPASVKPEITEIEKETISAQEKQDKFDSYNTPAFVAEQMPVYPGGDRELLRYVAKNTRYPSTAKDEKIMGRVTVKFCVTASGKVDKVSVLNGVHPSLDAEAVRVISGLPDFEPGKQGGKEVPVWYMVPVNFTIR